MVRGDMMKKFMLGLLFLYVISGYAFAWTYYPTEAHYNTTPGTSHELYLLFENRDNETINITITKEGYISSWITVTEPFITLNPGSISAPTQRLIQILIDVPSTAEGVYSGDLKLDDGNSTKYVNISIDVSKWVFSKEIIVDANTKVSLTNPNFVFEVHNIGATVELYVSGTKYDLGPNNAYESSNVKVTVIDRWDNQAKLKIQTTDQGTSISTEALQQQQVTEGSLEPLVSKWSFKVQEGTTKKMYVSVMNNHPYACDLKDLVMIGDVIETTSGRKPLDFGEVSLGKLDAGAEFVYPVEVNTNDVDLGTYTIRTQLIALCNGQREVAETVWELTVVSNVKPVAKTQSLQIDYPSSVNVNEEFTITVSNIPAGWNVYLIEQPNMNKTSTRRTEDLFEWKGKITQKGTYTIPLWIFKSDGSVEIKNLQISVAQPQQTNNNQQNQNELEIEIVPYPPKAKDTITITVRDKATLDTLDATINIKEYSGDQLVNSYMYAGPFQVDAGKKYCVEAAAQGYLSKELCFNVNLMDAKLDIPDSVKVGDSVTIRYVDLDGRPIPNAKITINDEVFNSAEVTFTAKKQTYNIEASADGYKTVTATIEPELSISILESTIATVGKESIIKLDNSANWEVRYNDTVVANGSGDEIRFTAENPGVYDIYVEGTYLDSVTVESGKLNVSTTQIVILIGVVAVLILSYKNKPIRRRRAGYATDTEFGSKRPLPVERI